MTAIFMEVVTLPLPCLGGRAGRPTAKTTMITAAMPTTIPPATSSGWCMPRYMRDPATNATITDDGRPGKGPEKGGGESRR